MTSKEAKSILNAYRNRNYNSIFHEYELAKAIDTILPKYVELEKRDTPIKVIKEVRDLIDAYGYYERNSYKCGSCKKVLIVDSHQKITR